MVHRALPPSVERRGRCLGVVLNMALVARSLEQHPHCVRHLGCRRLRVRRLLVVHFRGRAPTLEGSGLSSASVTVLMRISGATHAHRLPNPINRSLLQAAKRRTHRGRPGRPVAAELAMTGAVVPSQSGQASPHGHSEPLTRTHRKGARSTHRECPTCEQPASNPRV